MNKKAIIALLSALVLTVVASVTLILTVGQKASADSENVLVFDKLEYFNSRYDDFGNLVIADLSDYGVSVLQGGSYYGCGNYGCGNYGCGNYGCGNYGCGNYGSNGGANIAEIYVIIPDGVNKIQCSRESILANVNYPNGWGDKVTQLTLPESLTTIGYHAFGGFKIDNVTIPNNVEYIDNYAFTKCSNLTSIVIPASVTEIGYDVFDRCSNLTEIIVSTPQQYNHPNLAPYKNILVKNYSEVNFFDAVGGTNIDSTVVIKGEKVIEPVAPEKEGYTFKGWYNGEEAYDFNTPVTDDLTLTAHWEAISEPEPTEPEPTEPELTNPETPSEQENEVTVTNEDNKQAVALGIAGGSVAGLGSISAVAAAIVARRRRK